MTALPRFKNRSFAWAFFLVSGLISCGAWWGASIGLGTSGRVAILTVAGLVPITIQLVTGYGLDSAWVARFSRSEAPWHYWGSLVASAAVAVALGYGGYVYLVASSSGAAT